MPDISMCKGSIGAYICPNKDTCHRHTAEPSSYQSYFLNAPFEKETGKCDYYWNDGDDIKPNENEKID
jgi:hypothetical protein